jgi:uncharacterized membrane protein
MLTREQESLLALGGRSRSRLARHQWQTLLLLAFFNLAVLLPGTLATHAYAVVFLLITPGALLLSLLPVRPAEASVRIAWALGASVLLLMLLALVMSLALPPLGVTRPLGRVPLLLGVNALVLATMLFHSPRGDPLTYLLDDFELTWPKILAVAALTVLPLAAAAGAERLNNRHGGELSFAVLVAVGIGLSALVVFARRTPAWLVSVSLYTGTAALLLLSSMRTNYPYGYDIQTEFQLFMATLHHGVWHLPSNGNAYAAMLSITALPAALSSMTGIAPALLFKLCYPLIFSVFPVLVAVAARRFFAMQAALVGAIVVVVQGLFAANIVGLARQEIGLVYFALFIVTLADTSLDRRWRQGLVFITFLAMAISHYSTAYFSTLVLLGGYALYQLLMRLWQTERSKAVLTLPVVASSLGVVLLWNVVITRSAGDLANVAASLSSKGLSLLPGARGSSFLQRFLNADVRPSIGASQFARLATAYYGAHDRFLHPYPLSVTAHYPVLAASSPITTRHIPAIIPSGVTTASTITSELLLLLTGIGVLALVWRQRRSQHAAEIAALSLACLLLLGLLRLSGTISALYNAPRGQVQGAPLLGIALGLVLTWLLERRKAVAAITVGATAIGLLLLLFTESGVNATILGGGSSDLVTNQGEAFQRYNVTAADLAAASWVLRHQQPGQVLYADIYASLHLDEFENPPGLITTVIPTVLEPGGFVLASSTNVTDGTARSLVAGDFAVYKFPALFLEHVKDVVFTTGTTMVYR